jgi:hypothetical protein
MISLVLRKEGTCGYPPPDSEMVSLAMRRPAEHQQSLIENSLSSKGVSGRTPNFARTRMTIIWNYSIAMGLIQACLEICE